MIADYLANKKDKEDSCKPETEERAESQNEMLEKITEQLNNLETAPVRDQTTPPPSPAEYKLNDSNLLNGDFTDKIQGKYVC